MIYHFGYNAKSIDREIPVTPTNVIYNQPAKLRNILQIVFFWYKANSLGHEMQITLTDKVQLKNYYSKYMYSGYRADSLQGHCRIIHVYVTW